MVICMRQYIKIFLEIYFVFLKMTNCVKNWQLFCHTMVTQFIDDIQWSGNDKLVNFVVGLNENITKLKQRQSVTFKDYSKLKESQNTLELLVLSYMTDSPLYKNKLINIMNSSYTVWSYGKVLKDKEWVMNLLDSLQSMSIFNSKGEITENSINGNKLSSLTSRLNPQELSKIVKMKMINDYMATKSMSTYISNAVWVKWYSAFVKRNIEDVYALLVNSKIMKVMIIPDICSVEFGRGVGYDIIEHIPPTEIGDVSATKIREQMRKEGKL